MKSMATDGKRIAAWHFAQDTGLLGYGDGRVIRAGEIYHVSGAPVLCRRGLHASRRPIDALRWAGGSLICCVEVWGAVAEDESKLVGQYRKVLWEFDGTNLLHEFACRVAEDALKSAKITDKRSWNAIKAKRLWLRGKAADAEMAATQATAQATAQAAMRDAAWAAAADAAGAAAWAAAGCVARAAACAAAQAAAGAAHNRRLTAMIAAAHRRTVTE